MVRQMTSMASSPTGTLTSWTQRQPTNSVRAPPLIGPIA
jgi:hypothetical protein